MDGGGEMDLKGPGAPSADEGRQSTATSRPVAPREGEAAFFFSTLCPFD